MGVSIVGHCKAGMPAPSDTHLAVSEFLLASSLGQLETFPGWVSRKPTEDV